MKNSLLLFALLLGTLSITAQTVHFEYDAAGNRIKRTTITLPLAPPLKSTTDTTLISEVELAKELAKIEEKFSYETLAEGQIKVFPNPVEGALMVRLDNISNTEGITLQLYNSTGSLLQTQKMASDYSDFDMQVFAPGIYILRIIKQDEKLEYKIIKK